MNAVNGEQLFPQLDQPAPALPLPAAAWRRWWRAARGSQVFAPGGDGAGSDDDNAVARGVLLRTLAHQFDNVGAVQTRRSAGQHAGAQFTNQCLAAVHSISAVCNDEKKSAKVFVTGETRYANRHNAKSTQYVVKRGQAESLISFSLKNRRRVPAPVPWSPAARPGGDGSRAGVFQLGVYFIILNVLRRPVAFLVEQAGIGTNR